MSDESAQCNGKRGDPGKRYMTERFRILLVEDVASDAELALAELRRAGLRASHRIVDGEKSFVDALREFAPDVILFRERSARNPPSTRSRAAPPTTF